MTCLDARGGQGQRELASVSPTPARGGLSGLFEKRDQWDGSASEIPDKTLVEASPDIFHSEPGGPICNGRNLVGVRFDPFAIHKISPKLDFALSKTAFREVREKCLSSEVKQNSSNVGKVFVQGTRLDDDVIDGHICETTAVR